MVHEFVRTRTNRFVLQVTEDSYVHSEDSPEDLLVTLTTASDMLNHFDAEVHDMEIEIGMAHALIQTIAQTLHLKKGRKHNRGYLDHSQALRLAILCSALEMVFRCSSDTLQNRLNKGSLKALVDDSLLESFAILVETFLAWDGESTIRNVVLSKTTRVMYVLCIHAESLPSKILPSLFVMLQGGVTSDTRVDASCAIAALSTNPMVKHQTQFIQTFERISSHLVSTLTTASMIDYSSCDVVNAIFNLASGWSELRVKMAKRRDTSRAIVNIMMRPHTRSTGMRIALLLLSCAKTLAELQFFHKSNGLAILDSLAHIALLDSDRKNQRLAVFALAAIVVDPSWSDEQLVSVVDTLDHVVSVSKQMDVQIKAGVALCKKFSICGPQTKLNELLKEKVTSLMTFPDEAVQREALSAWIVKVDMGYEVGLLLNSDLFTLSLIAIIKNGSISLQRICFDLLERCTFTAENRDIICRCPLLLEAIVNCVIDGTVSGSMTYLEAIEVLLGLMADGNNIKHFQIFPELLPWLASLANTTTDNNLLKTTLVGIIISLSTCHLGLS